MAATGTKEKQPAATPAAVVVDPKFEWAEEAGSYVLRLTLTGFRKEDFRVQVDGAGRLTVRGATRPSAGGPGSSLHKVFQLPSTASLEDIAGRFEAGVLTLTVPKRASSGAGPTSVEEIRRKPTKEAAKPAPPAEVGGAKKMPKEESLSAKKMPGEDDSVQKKEAAADGATKKEAAAGAEPKESTLSRTTRQVAEHVKRMEEEANRRKQEQEKKPAPAAKKDQNPRPKAPQAAATPEKPALKLEPAIGEKAKAAVDRENLAERVRLCGDGEEARAKAAAIPTTMEEKTEREKAAVAWKERVVGELKGLTDMKWADNAVKMARKNKEVVAVGVAAFSLGFFVSQRLFGK